MFFLETQPGTKVLAEFYVDRKWYPAMIRYFDPVKRQYLIDWADKDEHDRFKSLDQVIKSQDSCSIS